MRISDWSSDGCASDLAALHLAVRMGAEVHVTSRDAEKCERALALGATAAYDSSGDWGVQAHVVVESVGPATWDRSVKAILPGGRLVVCGGTSDQNVEIRLPRRSEEHTSELQSLMRISYAVFCLKKKTDTPRHEKQQSKL